MMRQKKYTISPRLRALLPRPLYTAKSGAEIRTLRKTIGDSVPQFAQRVGVSEATVKSWELERRNPQGSALIILNQLSDLVNTWRDESK